MSATQITTLVNSDAKVVLAWAVAGPDNMERHGAIALSPEESLRLGRALITRAVKAMEVQSLFSDVDDVLIDAQSRLEPDAPTL